MVIDEWGAAKVMMPGDLIAIRINGMFQECFILKAFTHDQYERVEISRQPKTKAEKNQARLKQLRGRAGRWA